MKQRLFSRRLSLQWTGTLALTMTLIGSGVVRSSTYRLRFTDLVSRSEPAVAIGRRYIDLYQPRATLSELTKGLMKKPEFRQVLSKGNVRMLRCAVLREIRRDFSNGDVVDIDGWILSRTEARICACEALQSA